MDPPPENDSSSLEASSTPRPSSPSLSPLPMSLADISLTLPAATPITRSLSKSTPRDPQSLKHPPPARVQVKDRAEDDISLPLPSQPSLPPDACSDYYDDPPTLLPADSLKASTCSPLEQLPTEILESIAGYVGGQLGSAEVRSRTGRGRNWNALLRHPRRKDVSDLALVSPVWRRLVQERIFRHIKIHGTQTALKELGNFFIHHQHLQAYVKHLQVIVPIWETKKGTVYQRFLPSFGDLQGSVSILGGTAPAQPMRPVGSLEHHPEAAQMFRLASSNASVAEIFATARVLFPELQAVTIEAGHCKKSPQVKYFPPTEVNQALPSPSSISFSSSSKNKINFIVPSPPGPYLPTLPSVKVLILKGAWNIVRQPSELNILHNALPNLHELHCTYHAPKTDSYTTMCSALRPGAFPATIRHLNICLEGLYAKNVSSLAKWRKVYPTYHICRDLGAVLPQMESLTYTGRLCGALFSTATKAAESCLLQQHLHPQNFNLGYANSPTRLKRIDIILQNICRDIHATTDTTGIHNFPFIQAFEILVCQALRCLQFYTDVRFLRIRFIDFDSPEPLLNPKFQMEGNRAWGLWSDDILSLLRQARPNVQFEGARLLESDIIGALDLDVPMPDAYPAPAPASNATAHGLGWAHHPIAAGPGVGPFPQHVAPQIPPPVGFVGTAPYAHMQRHNFLGAPISSAAVGCAGVPASRSHSVEFYAKMAQNLGRHVL